jgi:hypothetical protein
MSFNILTFKETFSEVGGGQHDCLFEITIPIATGLTAAGTAAGTTTFSNTNGLLSLMCEASNLPGMQLATSGVNRYGYGPVEQKPFMPIFSTCDVRLLADGQGQIWTYMQSWLNFILNFNVSQGIGTPTGFAGTGTGLGGTATGSQNPYELNYLTDYAVDITITLYQPDATQSMALVLRNAYPKFIGDPQLNWGSNNIMRLPISFSFVDWFNSASATTSGVSATSSTTLTNGIVINLS